MCDKIYMETKTAAGYVSYNSHNPSRWFCHLHTNIVRTATVSILSWRPEFKIDMLPTLQMERAYNLARISKSKIISYETNSE